jgi:hypothetical protein
MDHLRTSHAALCQKIGSGAKMDDATLAELNEAILAFAKTVR